MPPQRKFGEICVCSTNWHPRKESQRDAAHDLPAIFARAVVELIRRLSVVPGKKERLNARLSEKRRVNTIFLPNASDYS
jgi:hypothetical protein